MNSYTTNIANRIRQPEHCCVHCGKSYKKRETLNKHVTICEFLQKSNKTILEEEDTLPSYKDLCKIVSQLVKSNNALKKEVEELKASTTTFSKKKKKINIIEWLNTRQKTTILFDEFIHTIHITKDNVLSFIDKPFMEALNELFSQYVYHIDPNTRPICAFTQKSNTFYIQDTNNWTELPDDKLIKFLNRVHSKIVNMFCDWKTAKKKEIKESDDLKTKCEKTQIKLMSVIFSEKPTLTKVKTMIYQKIKEDVQDYNIEL